MKKYALRAFVALFFLMILPGTVVYIASARTGVGLVQPWKEYPVPEYEIFNTFAFRWMADYWIMVAPEVEDDGMERIVRDIVERDYVGKRRMLFYFYSDPDFGSRSDSTPPAHLSTAAYIWSTREGIQVHDVPAPRGQSGGISAYFKNLQEKTGAGLPSDKE